MGLDVVVDVSSVLPTKITRKLEDDEVLCPECSGVGLVKEKDYRGEYIRSCYCCYGRSVIKRCEHCGEVKRGGTAHYCDGMRREHDQKTEHKEQEKWAKAEKMTLDEAYKRYDQVVVGPDTYVHVEDVLRHIIGNGWEPGDPIPRVWGTTVESFSTNADRVIEDAIQDLHEEACISSNDEADLNDFLQEWCARETVINSTQTYYPDEKVAIVVTEHDLVSEVGDSHAL